MLRRVTAVGGIVVVVALGVWAWNYRATEQAWLAMEAQASAAKTEIDTRFAVGAPQSEVLVFLRERFDGELRMGPDTEPRYFFPVGTEPNRDWRMICGPWKVGVAVLFRGARLVATTTTALGTDCL